MSEAQTFTSRPEESADAIRPVAAVILAAGRGTRMQSDLPKVAHEVADRAMVWWVVDAVRRIGATPIILVVGHGHNHVEEIFVGDDEDLRYVMQHEQLGTAHAVDCARSELQGFDGDVLVLCGDGPLIRPTTLDTLLSLHQTSHADATLATSVISDPTGYGRIVRDANGRFEAIVEHKNASNEQRAIHEINPSYYAFRADALLRGLSNVDRNELSGEYYLTDVPGILRNTGGTVELIDAVPPEDVLSINTLEQLADVDAILRGRREGAR